MMEKQAEGQLKWPWPEPYGIAVTFTALHIVSKLSDKHFTVDALSGLSSPAPAYNLPIWISFPSLSLTVNNAFVAAPFPPFMPNI